MASGSSSSLNPPFLWLSTFRFNLESSGLLYLYPIVSLPS